MKALLGWLDQRTGYKKIVNEILFENIPGGPRWRYIWGSALTFCIFVQFATGIMLWMAYSPSSQTAWESVYFIQEEMNAGWLLRGIHHYAAQLMTVLLILHLMQVVIDKAYTAPREVNYWFGLGLLFLVMALSLTGYLLPWDQKGYWATKVATNMVAITPVIGESLQKIVIGGADYGHHTLTRFFALHAGVLPGLLILLIVVHIYLFRRHGIKAKKPFRRADTPFWPEQVFRDLVAALAVMAAILGLVLWLDGAHLSAPADPAERYPARPDWYFMFLFQFLKYFKGEGVLWGGIYIPAFIVGLLFLMPFIGRWKQGHRFNLIFLYTLLGGFVYLTYIAYAKDAKDEEFQFAQEQARKDAERIRVLANAPAGIPQGGATSLLRSDPYTQGPKIFADKCASCHAYGGMDGLGRELKEPPSAPDLKGVGSREWLAGFVDPDQIATAKYFGGTHFVDRDGGNQSRMVEYVMGLRDLSPTGQGELAKVVAAVSAQAELKSQKGLDDADSDLIREGSDLFWDGITGLDEACIDCHGWDGEESSESRTPDLTGWMSREYMIEFIKNPEHPRFYGSGNDRMPVYGEEGTLTEKQIGLVVDWLRGEWYEPVDAQMP